MPLRETEAIVIKSYDLAEADRVVVFFTRSFGLVRGVAKGVKRPGSRFGSTLEPFSKIKLSFFQKEDRELVSIRDAELLNSRFEVASDPARLAIFAYFGELLTTFAAPHDADEILFRMLDSCLSAGNDADELPALQLYFDVWMLRISGYLPDWRHCSLCRIKRTEMSGATIITGFSLVCSKCKTLAGATLEKFGKAELEVFHNVEKLGPSEFVKISKGYIETILKLRRLTSRLITITVGTPGIARESLDTYSSLKPKGRRKHKNAV